MKKLSYLSFFFLLLILNNKISVGQESVTVNIDFNNCAVGMERSGAPTIPAPALPDFASYSWTCQGIHCIGRTLMSVDLNQIPAGAVIMDAKLSLFADPACGYLGYFGQPTYGTLNRGVVKRITSPWDPNTVTWNNAPSTTTTNQGKIHTSQSVSQDYTIDVTSLVQDMLDNPSYGLILEMSDETNFYKSLIFGTCLHPDESLRPKLVVTYTTGEEKTIGHSMSAIEVDVYPNPATDKVIFEFNDFAEGDQLQLSVFGVTGKLIQQYAVPASDVFTLNLQLMAPGMYYYKVENTTTHTTFAGKFVRQ